MVVRLGVDWWSVCQPQTCEAQRFCSDSGIQGHTCANLCSGGAVLAVAPRCLVRVQGASSPAVAGSTYECTLYFRGDSPIYVRVRWGVVRVVGEVRTERWVVKWVTRRVSRSGASIVCNRDVRDRLSGDRLLLLLDTKITVCSEFVCTLDNVYGKGVPRKAS